MSIPFHLAFSVKNIGNTKQFYVDILGCTVTKATKHWLNINFFGHQLSIHENPQMKAEKEKILVEEKEVPLRHFGVILKKKEWEDLAKKLEKDKAKFLIEPKLKHEKQVCEQAIMFLEDPSGNGIEFKFYTDPKNIFSNC